MSGIPALVLALALPAAVAWTLLARLVPVPGGSVLALAGRLSTSVVMGLGLSALLPLPWLLAGGALDDAYVRADALLFCALLVGLAAWPRRKRGSGSALVARSAPSSGKVAGNGIADRGLELVAVSLLGAALLVALWRFAAETAASPHGGWDAWGIWNLRARYLVRSGEGWRSAFAPEMSRGQTGYPLLLPLAVARLWAYAGETTLAPAIVAGAFTLAAPVILASAAGASAGPVAGAAAGLLLAGTPTFVAIGAAQYADVPVAALLVAGLGSLLEAEPREGRERTGVLAVGGLLLGLAGWAKNEGVAAAVATVFLGAFLAWRARGIRAALAECRPIALGAFLPTTVWIAFRLTIGSAISPALSEQSLAELVGKLADPERWLLAVGGVARRLPGFGLGLPAIAIAVAWLLGAKPRVLLRSLPFIVAATLYLVFVTVFVVTTVPVAWHLDTAGERLLLQPWPALLLGLFAAAAPAPSTSDGESRPHSPR